MRSRGREVCCILGWPYFSADLREVWDFLEEETVDFEMMPIFISLCLLTDILDCEEWHRGGGVNFFRGMRCGCQQTGLNGRLRMWSEVVDAYLVSSCFEERLITGED